SFRPFGCSPPQPAGLFGRTCRPTPSRGSGTRDFGFERGLTCTPPMGSFRGGHVGFGAGKEARTMPATPTHCARRRLKAGAARQAPRQAPAQPESRASLYDEVTRRIIAELEAGRFPWVQPWGHPDSAGLAPGLPRNALTGRNYSGINVLILWGAVIA